MFEKRRKILISCSYQTVALNTHTVIYCLLGSKSTNCQMVKCCCYVGLQINCTLQSDKTNICSTYGYLCVVLKKGKDIEIRQIIGTHIIKCYNFTHYFLKLYLKMQRLKNIFLAALRLK